MKSLMETLWAALMFWKHNVGPKQGKDFQFNDFDDTDLTGIRIIAGKYIDVIYYYTNAAITEEGMGARLKFGYQIVQPGEHDKKDLENSEEFVTMIGDILTEIITTEQQIESPRTIYSEGSDL